MESFLPGTSLKEPFKTEAYSGLLAVKYLPKKAPSQKFDTVLNACLSGIAAGDLFPSRKHFIAINM